MFAAVLSAFPSASGGDQRDETHGQCLHAPPSEVLASCIVFLDNQAIMIPVIDSASKR
jgi:hypothetical protein